MKFDIEKIIEKLKLRKVFHSEVDFQFALGWTIKEMYQEDVVVNFETLLDPTSSKSERLDLLVTFKGMKIPIELKYFHSKIDIQGFLLNKQNDTWRCYKYFADISRVEQYINNNQNCEIGYAILLCNEPKYWKASNPNNIYYPFRLEDQRKIDGKSYNWAENKKTTNSSKKYGRAINLLGNYTFNWKHFSFLENVKDHNKEFKYLLCEIKNQ